MASCGRPPRGLRTRGTGKAHGAAVGAALAEVRARPLVRQRRGRHERRLDGREDRRAPPRRRGDAPRRARGAGATHGGPGGHDHPGPPALAGGAATSTAAWPAARPDSAAAASLPARPAIRRASDPPGPRRAGRRAGRGRAGPGRTGGCPGQDTRRPGARRPHRGAGLARRGAGREARSRPGWPGSPRAGTCCTPCRSAIEAPTSTTS